MPLHDGPTHHPIQMQCIAAASARYAVPQLLIRAVMRQEGGCGKRSAPNKNGTVDLGCMQINSSHLPVLRGYGISPTMLQNNDCLNIQVGTWFLRQSLSGAPDFWRGVGAYNSGGYTAEKEKVNARYRTQVWNHLVDIWQGH